MTEIVTDPPKGFSIVFDELGNQTIISKSAGMGCMLFLLTAATIAIVSGPALSIWHDPSSVYRAFRDWLTLVILLVVLACALYFTSFVAFHLFGSTIFALSSSSLTIRYRLFGLSSVVSIDREKMKSLEQIKDGGEGEDSFPSWGLNLLAERRFKLLARQPIDKSEWLGQRLADFFRVPFNRSSIQE